MYTKVNNISELISEAETFIVNNDRLLYASILEIVEKFCHDNKFLVDCTNLLLDKPINRDDFTYKIYFKGGFYKAMELADLVLDAKAPHIDIKTTSLKTVIKDRVFELKVNLRTVVYMVNSNVDYDRISVIKPGHFIESVPVISPLIALIETYHKLYDYSLYKKWKAELETESTLYTSLSGISGGWEGKPHKFHKSHKNLLEVIDGVIVGDHALNFGRGRPQIISNLDINILLEQIKKVYHTPLTVSETTFPFDLRLIKYTVKADGRDIIDIFNAASYEIIPYNELDSYKIGNPIILARFALIQYFILTNMGIDARLVNYAKFREDMIKAEAVDLFTKTKLYGVNVSEKIILKQLNGDNMFKIYYPAVERKRKAMEGGNSNPIPLNGTCVEWNNGDHLRLVQKITGDKRPSIAAILKSYQGSLATKWIGKQNKNTTRYDTLLKFVEDAAFKRITYLDIGTGDGMDYMLIANKINATKSYAFDIDDFRLDKTFGELIISTLNKPINLLDNSINVVSLFHSIHHLKDATYRLRDIARLLQDGGIIMIKDHDVQTSTQANMVSLEHFVYSIGEDKATINDNKRYQEIEPMYYYSAQAIREFIVSLGFTERYFIEYKNPTRVYLAVFQKNKTEIIGSGIYKGEFSSMLEIY
jgi:ubiquinone/menaquinone biosynthesis C-methylase UbiE